MSSGDHGESFIKTPKQLIVVVLLSLLLPIFIIMLLANFVVSGKRTGAGADTMKTEAIDARIKPVAGHVLKVAGDLSKLKSGQEVYNAKCATCHKEGAVGAPKLGDTAAWAPRLKNTFDALWNSALKGKGSMGAQGGGDWDDIEIGRAVAYMANAAGGKFEDPKAAPAAAPAATAPAGAVTTAAVAAVVIPAAVAAAPAAAGASGKALFDGACAVCHAAGGNFPGSPKYGDKAAWSGRMAGGVAGLVASVVNGKGAMPPKGGKGDATEGELKAAVEYMLASVK